MYHLMTVNNNMSDEVLSSAVSTLLSTTPSLKKTIGIAGDDTGAIYSTGVGSHLAFGKDINVNELNIECDDDYTPDAGELAAITAALDTGE